MTYPRVRLSIRICAPLLLTALAVAFVLAGFMNDGPGGLEAAETAQNEPAAPGAPAAPVAPAIPPLAPGDPPPAAAPATPPQAPSVTPPGPPAKTKKAATGKKAAKGAKGKKAPPPGKTAPPGKYNAGEDPEYAERCGWPVKTPPPLPGSILPGKRIVDYYGNPLSKRMGALGEYPKDEMLRRLKGEVAKWEAADPSLPVQPALHLIAVVALGEAC